jgi:hypothetical protein
MGSSTNNHQYNEPTYDIYDIMFIALLLYFVITITFPICYYGYKLITTCTRRNDYIDI